MMTDHNPQSQVERQLWAAYRLILQWPKRDTPPVDPTGGEPEQDETDRAGSVRPDCDDVSVTERAA